METPGIYRKKVIDFLDRMPVGSVYIIDHICKTENKEMFIEIVKEYIISTRRAYSNGIEFTSDYSRIRKMDVLRITGIVLNFFYELNKTIIMEQKFDFKGNLVRMKTDQEEQYWFAGIDVCNILGYADSYQKIKTLDEDEYRLARITDGQGK